MLASSTRHPSPSPSPQAARYLQKVSYYKDSGLSEKAIHEAYEEAGRDWDQALDTLTQHSVVCVCVCMCVHVCRVGQC